MSFKQMFINFRKHVAVILFLLRVGTEEINKYIQYEVSISIYLARVANRRKVPKWLPFKIHNSESLNISCAYIRGICPYLFLFEK